MAQALALVRQELGSNAVVLATRNYKQGGVFGFGGRQVVEVTAADGASLGSNPTAANKKRPKPTGAKPRPQRDATAGELIRRTYAVAQAELTKRHQQQNTSAVELAPPASQSTLTQGSQEAVTVPGTEAAGELAQEVQAVKKMVRRMMHHQRDPRKGGAKPDMPDTLFDQYLSLLEQEVAIELADEVIDQVRGRLTDEQLDDETAVRAAITTEISRLIPVDDATDRLPPSANDRPRVIALIGPTGVGKTTTIAKLTAAFKLKERKKVALITLDTYRIAAVDQLRTYANILGVPLHVVTSPGELTEAIEKCTGFDAVLIDTAGRSQKDDPRLDHLKNYLEVARPDEVHLVLSSTCSQPVLMDTIERFSCIHIDRIIFTKLDEAVTFGVLLNVAARVKKALSYVTTGQEVPHHIEPGRAQRLAEIVLLGKVTP